MSTRHDGYRGNLRGVDPRVASAALLAALERMGIDLPERWKAWRASEFILDFIDDACAYCGDSGGNTTVGFCTHCPTGARRKREQEATYVGPSFGYDSRG